jgi:aminopeptidase C
MANTQYKGTLSSGGKQVTMQANQEIIFNSPTAPNSDEQIKVTSLVIEAFDTQLHVILNDEITVHEIDPYESLVISDMVINKFTILEDGATYRWEAMYE